MSPPDTDAPGSTSKSLDSLRARVLELARRQPAPTRAQFATRKWLITLATLSVSLLAFQAAGGVRAAPRPTALIVETAVGASLVGIAIAWLGLGRGHSVWGRPRAWLASAVLLAPVLLLGITVAVSSRYPAMFADWHTRPGFRCMGLSAALAVAPLFGALWLRRGSDPVHPHWSAAAIGATVGAGVWVLVHLWCPVGHVPHLFVGHVFPLVALIVLSAAIGGKVLAVRARRARVSR